MSSKWRRFEVLLPLQFNDGRDVPTEWLAEAVLEIVDHFGAASYETQKLKGHWRQGGVLYRDNLVRVVVDVPDSAKSRQWMKQFKSRWKARLQQHGLWMGEPSHRGGIAMGTNRFGHGFASWTESFATNIRNAKSTSPLTLLATEGTQPCSERSPLN